MRRSLILACVMLLFSSVVRAQVSPRVVEPSELEKRSDLVGAAVSVDDRVRLFLPHPGRGVDEILLKRTPVVFRLPAKLRWTRAPEASAARVDGVLKRDADGLFVEVTAVTLLEDDMKRLERGVAALTAADAEGRAAWARWAERRGSEFADEALRKRARELDAQALQLDSDRPDADPAARWLRLAHRARGLKREAEAGFLAHRAFRARLAANEPAALEALADEVSAFFPDSPKPGGIVASGNQGKVEIDPIGTYQAAPADVRVTLDHRLWADIVQKALERRAAAEPLRAFALATEARRRIPDRPGVATHLDAAGVEAQTRDVIGLSLEEVEALARRQEATGHQGSARDLRKSWLENRRTAHLDAGDADGRIGLAKLYKSMLGDAATADTLLREAAGLAPDSKELADTYRKLGYRRVDGRWNLPDAPERPDNINVQLPTDSLINATPRQVRDRLGKPDRIGRTATQGRVVLQWTYVGTKGTQIINFAQSPGTLEPTVIRHHALP